MLDLYTNQLQQNSDHPQYDRNVRGASNLLLLMHGIPLQACKIKLGS